MKNLCISFVRADMKDCQLIYDMQVESFKDLLDKYRDYETNPAAEPLERTEERMLLDFVDYYLICLGDKKVGALRVVRLDDHICRLGLIFILPKYQEKGYAKQSISKVEMLYPTAKKWELMTIKQEANLCCFYETMGYKFTGEETWIQDNMTIIGYSKGVI